jgi:Holliday junction resolvasome RuvABC DNA-binding subunit
VQAATLQKSWGQHQLTVAEVKALTQDNSLTETEAEQRLEQLGYAPADAGAIVLSWRKAAKAAHAGLTQAKILAYLAHGVLQKPDAYDRLIGLGIRAEDARFLVDHPTLSAPVSQKPVTAGAVTAAYIDGAIDRGTAETLLLAIPTSPVQVALLLTVADDKLAKGVKPKAAHRTISEAQVIDAFKQGLAADTWAVRELVTLGYSDADAQLLVAIEQTKLDGKVPAGWAVLN